MFKLYAALFIVILVGGVVTGGYFYVDNLRKENVQLQKDKTILKENNAELKDGIKKQQKTINAVKRDSERKNRIIIDTTKKFQKSRSAINELEKKLERHDLGMLARRKPGLVENIVNKATKNSNRCFEILSGSPLTKEELAATKKSQINSECYDIANPNYKESK